MKTRKALVCLLALLLCAACLSPALAGEATDADNSLRVTWRDVGRQESPDWRGLIIWQIDAYLDGQPIQTLYAVSEFVPFADDGDMITLRDVNFDGWPDIDLKYFAGAKNSLHVFYLWDAGEGRFLPAQGTGADVYDYTLHPEQKLLLTYGNNGYAGVLHRRDAFAWSAGGALVRVRSSVWDTYQKEDLAFDGDTYTQTVFHNSQIITETMTEFARDASETVLYSEAFNLSDYAQETYDQHARREERFLLTGQIE